MYRTLTIFIEGSDDGRFFGRIIKPIFEGKYDHVGIWEYAQKFPRKTRSYINNINAMSSGNIVADYIYVTDFNDAPCFTYRKQAKQSKLPNLDKEKIIVARKEIEGWYLAGLDETCSKKCGIIHCQSTDTITKEQFNNLIPKKFESSRIDFCQEIIKYFNLEIAKRKNESFRYFLEDFLKNYIFG